MKKHGNMTPPNKHNNCAAIEPNQKKFIKSSKKELKNIDTKEAQCELLFFLDEFNSIFRIQFNF